MMKCVVYVLLTFTMLESLSQTFSEKKITKLADDNFLEGIELLREFLLIPNNGRNSDNIDNNVLWCQSRFEKLGFDTDIVISKGVKHVFAKKEFHKKAPYILFYLQIDGQPVDSSEWNQESPYLPVLKECHDTNCDSIGWNMLDKDWNPNWKIFARSASDSKGPAIAFMETLRIINQQQVKPSFNVKVIMDFQEEMGSPTLPDLVRNNKELLNAEAMLIMDGTRHPSNLPTLTFGARGIATMTLTVFGANKNLHSGQYGNFAPNPVFKLSRILAAMKDSYGKVLIPGFYEGIELSAERKEILNNIPEDKDILLDRLGLNSSDEVGNTYQEALQYPSLNVRGLRAAWVGKDVRTIIPSEAIAEIDMRLVPETSAERQINLVTEFIQGLDFHVIDSLPTKEERAKYPNLIRIQSRIGSRPFRTDLNSSLGVWLGEAMDRAFGPGKYIKMQSTGGSQPIAPFINTLNIPAISVRIPNPDNSIHAPNENLRLGNFHEGIRMCLGILTQKYEINE